MARNNYFKKDLKVIRSQLNHSREIAMEIHRLEQQLVAELIRIDQNRYYVWFGFNSLRGFCNFSLKFSKTQSQRIVTLVRQTPTHPDDVQLWAKGVGKDVNSNCPFAKSLDGKAHGTNFARGSIK